MLKTNLPRNPVAVMLRATVVIITFVLGLLLVSAPALAQIPWRSIDPAPVPDRPSAEVAQTVRQLVPDQGVRHLVVQFSEPVSPAERTRLREAGVELMAPLSHSAYYAAVNGDQLNVAALAAVPSLKMAQAPQRGFKLHPTILNGPFPAHGVVGLTLIDDQTEPVDVVAVYALFHRDVPMADVIALVHSFDAEIISRLETINGLVMELPRPRIEPLADRDEVLWIEPPLPPFDELNDSNRVITQADDVHILPYNLSGLGVSVLVYDGGYGLESHADFQGRLTQRDSSGLSNHSTHVAGTIGGAGIVNPIFKGMAPAVTLEAYGFEQAGGLQMGFLYTDPGDLETDYNDAINVQGVDISNNSIGTNTAPNGFPCSWEGDYNVTSNLIDSIVGGSLGAPFRVVWANGNERQGAASCGATYHTTAPPACAKNHITVGALNSNDDSVTSFTSWGPCDDGRMKPDLAAPGCQSNGDNGVTSTSSSGNYATLCGTSMASPTVCGLSALLLQDFRQQFPGLPDFRNSTLKVLLAHAALDIENVGPDYKSGFGSVRIKDSVDFMRTGNFFEASVDQGGTHSVLVIVEPTDPQLKITIAWDDVPGTPAVDPVLVNDLDLVVTDPSGTQHFPWTLDPNNPANPAVQTQADHVNNIEQVFVDAPAAGVWSVDVVGFDVAAGPQTFSLAASPFLVNCSSQGIVALDSALFGCEASAQIRVVDCDLNTDNALAETVTVTASSPSEPGGETVVLTENGVQTADFRGSLIMSETNSAGVLQVADGETITISYIDADDGQGGTNITRTAVASLDCVSPVISNVQVVAVAADSATVTFDTDESSIGTVRYGTACDALLQSVNEADSNTTHTLVLTGLGAGSTFFFAVDAADAQSNSSTNDNGGACYTFCRNVLFADNFETDQGWTTQVAGATAGFWERGVPVNDPGWPNDPASDSDGSGQCFLTQNQIGNTDVDNGAVILISPVIPLPGGGITITYDYFLKLSNSTGGIDRLLVEIKTSLGLNSWLEIARHDTDGGLVWHHNVIDQATLDALGVVLGPTTQLRFTANDDDPQGINESGVDAVEILSFDCQAGLPIPGAPIGVSATDGTRCDGVQIVWNATPDAADYEVWRNTIDDNTSATMIASGVAPLSFDDTTAGTGDLFYWIKACNVSGCSPFSASDVGHVGLPGDFTDDGFIDGADIQGYVGTVVVTPLDACVDVAAPIGSYDGADMAAFVSALLGP